MCVFMDVVLPASCGNVFAGIAAVLFLFLASGIIAAVRSSAQTPTSFNTGEFLQTRLPKPEEEVAEFEEETEEEEEEEDIVILLTLQDGTKLEITCWCVDSWEYAEKTFTGQWENSHVVRIENLTTGELVEELDSDKNPVTWMRGDVVQVRIDGDEIE